MHPSLMFGRMLGLAVGFAVPLWAGWTGRTFWIAVGWALLVGVLGSPIALYNRMRATGAEPLRIIGYRLVGSLPLMALCLAAFGLGALLR